MRAGGIDVRDAAEALRKFGQSMESQNSYKNAMAPQRVFTASQELKELIDAETERMKKKHDKIMKEALKRLFYIALLIGALAIYETWIRPDLESAILKQTRNVKR